MAIFWAALIAGLTYWPGSELALPSLVLIVWKGVGVGLLALWAALRAKNRDGWLLAGMLALGAIGDVVLEAVGLEAGAVAFLFGHLVAILLYSRNRRRSVGWWPLVLVPATVVAAALLPDDKAAVPGIAFYTLGLAAMAACALMSRFRLAALGAWLFVASDLLIFARLGPFAESFIPDLLVWPLYFAGQSMIAWDVARLTQSGAAPAR